MVLEGEVMEEVLQNRPRLFSSVASNYGDAEFWRLFCGGNSGNEDPPTNLAFDTL